MAPYMEENTAATMDPPMTIPIKERPALYGWQTTNEDGYTINEEICGTRRPLRILVMGAGPSGINFSKFAEEQLQDVEVVVYEKNHDIGGTWLENRYPGCACDIPAVTYNYTWEPHIWSKYYVESPEIWHYFNGVVQKYGLKKYMKFHHRIDGAEWDEDEGKWDITVTDMQSGKSFIDRCDVFLNAGGNLNHWEWPDIKGLKEFQGLLCHSANYPEGLDLKGKRVAVVGMGSSGVQIIARIQSEVAQLYSWVRTPTWMTAGFAEQHAGPNGTNFFYSEEQKKRFREDPAYFLKYRKAVETEMNVTFMSFHKGTPECQASLNFAYKEMTTKLKGHAALAEALIPKDFPVGCKRPTPGNGFLEALVSENVTTYLEKSLNEITAKGFIDPAGNEVEVDVIILATGFNTSWVPRFPVRANGVNLQDLYREAPIGYLGLATPQIPNYFTFYGPYGPLGQGSALPMIELFSNYIITMVKKMQTEDIKSYTPKKSVAEDFAEHADLYNKRTVWSAHCRSWFKNHTYDGRVSLHPGTRLHYMEMIRNPRYEDYDIKHRSRNVWNWLGNGFHVRDFDGRDLTWYMGKIGGQDKQIDF